MQVELECQQVQLTTRKDHVWENMDFGRVRRYFYGPSLHYSQDTLSFLDETAGRKGGDLPMTISLRITLLSGKVLYAEKSFVLTTENLRLYGQTKCDGLEPRSTYEFCKLVRSKTPPFSSSSSLVITKFIRQE
jgi:hypothetical protein